METPNLQSTVTYIHHLKIYTKYKQFNRGGWAGKLRSGRKDEFPKMKDTRVHEVKFLNYNTNNN